MLTVLLLAGAEKLINVALMSDEITQAGLEPLAGKVLRLNMVMPELHLDVIFNHKRLRFEPVTTPSVFEPRGGDDAVHLVGVVKKILAVSLLGPQPGGVEQRLDLGQRLRHLI